MLICYPYYFTCVPITAGEDYEILTEIVEFQVGEVEKSVLITIFDDKRIEQNETFSVYLTGGAGVHLSPISRAEITIENNDGNYRI